MKNLVWLASYPRSGNTWFRIFLSFLFAGTLREKNLNLLEVDMFANSRVMFDELTGLKSSEMTMNEINDLKPSVFKLLSDEISEPCYLKTHDQFFLNDDRLPVFPLRNSLGCVYIIRNPLDVAVSNALYFNQSADKVISNMNKPDYSMHVSNFKLYPVIEERINTWSEHAKSWLHAGINLHVMRYEDMVMSPFATFSATLEFLGLHFSDAQILQAISETSFENLKKSEAESGFKEKLQSCKAFFRNGKPGNWKTFLTDIQIKKIVDDHREVMERFGYI